VQEEVDEVGPNFPRAQSLHVLAPARANFPAPQAENELEPSVEQEEPAGQSLQRVLPASGL